MEQLVGEPRSETKYHGWIDFSVTPYGRHQINYNIEDEGTLNNNMLQPQIGLFLFYVHANETAAKS